MIDFFIKIKEAWDAGGFFIYPIHLIAVLVVAITIERVFWLFFKSSMNAQSFLDHIAPVVGKKDLQGAIQFCDSLHAPGARLAKSLLVRSLSKGTRQDIEATIESSLAREQHPLERRTAYLTMLGNISTLLGLLGTISGLIASFRAAASVDPTRKAELLATGISEAMNCTAYGLIVAIFALLMYAILQGKTQRIIDELKEISYEIRGMLHLES